MNINESLPRTVGQQQHRNNIPATTESEYYKRTLTIPMLDHLIAEMKERFQFDTSCILNQVRLLLPSELVKSTESTTLTQKDIPDLIRLYGDDIPSVPSLDSELHCWQTKWRSTAAEGVVLPSNPVKTLTIINGDFYPNIQKLFQIICTLGVTSSECERSISRLRYLKTYLRSTMTEARLNGLALLYIHRDISCNATDVVDVFSKCHPRRILLANPLIDN